MMLMEERHEGSGDTDGVGVGVGEVDGVGDGEGVGDDEGEWLGLGLAVIMKQLKIFLKKNKKINVRYGEMYVNMIPPAPPFWPKHPESHGDVVQP